MSSERTDTTDRPSHTCSSAEDLVPDWEGCGRAGRCPDPIWLPAVHPSVRSGSRVLSVAITLGSSPASVVRFQKNKEKKETRRSSPARRHRCLACRRRGLRAPRPALHLAPSAPRTAPRAAAASRRCSSEHAAPCLAQPQLREPRPRAPPHLRVPRRPGAAAAQPQARSSKRCRGASRCCRHLLEAPSKIVSLVSAGRAEKSLSPKYFSYRKCCLLDNYPCSSV